MEIVLFCFTLLNSVGCDAIQWAVALASLVSRKQTALEQIHGIARYLGRGAGGFPEETSMDRTEKNHVLGARGAEDTWGPEERVVTEASSVGSGSDQG